MNHGKVRKFAVQYSLFVILIPLFFLRLVFLPKLDLKDGQLIKVTAVLKEEPQIFGNQQKFNLGQFEIWTEKFPQYHYQDRVEITGRVKAMRLGIQNPLTSSGIPLLSFKTYLLSYPEVKSITGSKSITGITGMAILLKEKLLNFYGKSFSKPYDGILAGIVLGDKSLIGFDFWEKLKLTGTLHIMVASGMNIAFVCTGTLSFLTLFFKRRISILLLVLLIYFYSILTGLSPSIVRAAIMISLVYLSQLIGREVSGTRVLFLTGGVMLAIDPLLVKDVGFQLSFLATAGLVFLQPKISQSKLFLFRNGNFSSTLAAQIMTLPILVVNFGQMNLASPFINLAILWAVPFILQVGIVVGILGLIFKNMGILSSYLIFPLLFYINQVINLSAKFAFFQVRLPKTGIILALLYYIILGFLIKKSANPKILNG